MARSVRGKLAAQRLCIALCVQKLDLEAVQLLSAALECLGRVLARVRQLLLARGMCRGDLPELSLAQL